MIAVMNTPPCTVTVEPPKNGVVVLHAEGELDIATVAPFKTRLSHAIDTAGRAVVVDLTGLRYFDSSGLAALITARIRAEQRGVQLRVVAAEGMVRRVFRMTAVDTTFSMFPTVIDAATFAPSTPARFTASE